MSYVALRSKPRFEQRLQSQIARTIREVEMFEIEDTLVFENETIGQRYRAASQRTAYGSRTAEGWECEE